MILKHIKIFILAFCIVLTSCRGIEFENQKIAKAEEFPLGETMVFIAEEKNKYQNKFGSEIWNLKSGDGTLYFKDYIVANVKKFIEKMMILKLTASDLNVIIGAQDEEKLKSASDEYYNMLEDGDLKYMNSSPEDIYNAFKDFHVARLVIDNLSKNANTELSISEAKVIKVQYIIFDDKKNADKTIVDLAAKGANFSYFAKTRSIDTEIEMIIKRGDEMSTRFPELFYLSNGQVSEILQYKNRYYIFKCVGDYLAEETELRRIEILRAMKNNEIDDNFKKYEELYNLRSNSMYWKEIDLSAGSECVINSFENIYYKYFPKDIR